MEAAAQPLFHCLERIPDPRQARGVRHHFQAILRLTLLGLVSGQTTMAPYCLVRAAPLGDIAGTLGFRARPGSAPHHFVPNLGGSAPGAIATGGFGVGSGVGVGPGPERGGGWEVSETVHRHGGEPFGAGERAGSRPKIVPGAMAAGGTPLRIFDQ